MSKPLELVIHEKVPGQYGREATYNSPDGFWAYPESHVDGYAQDKRLTDAELAAECYKAQCEWLHAGHNVDDDIGYPFSRRDVGRMNARMGVLMRFATLPHYDETQS